MQRVLYVTSKWPSKSNSNDGGDSTINEVIRSLSQVCTLDLLCFRDDINEEVRIEDINKTIIVSEDFANFSTYSDRNGDKFYIRIVQADIVAKEIRKIADYYQIIIVQHVSFLLGLENDNDIFNKIVLLPMFTSTSYIKSGEYVPEKYIKLEKNCVRKVSRIITPSYVERDILVEDCEVDARRIKVIPRAIHFEYAERKNSKGMIRLVYIASIRVQKNHMAALRIVSLIKRTGINVVLTCVGAIQDEAIYKECCDYISANDLNENISFVGNVSDGDIEKIFSESDINISVSNWETFGRGIYEGMSTGIPTVIFDKLDCVVRAKNIDVYPITVESEEDMAREIIKLVETEEYYKNESQKGLAIQKKLCFKEICRQIQEVIMNS